MKFDLLSFVDGVLKVDPANLNGRKGNSIPPGLCNPFQWQIQLNKTSNLTIYATLTPTSTVFIVFVYLACAFRYGSEDLDVIGLSCRRDIWVKRVQVFPVIAGGIGKTPMQEALVKKAGEQAHHFSFEVQKRNSMKLNISLLVLFGLNQIIFSLTFNY